MNKFAHLQQSNRQKPKELEVSSFNSEGNRSLRSFISKEASHLEDNLDKQAMDKQAFFSRGVELFGNARAMIANKLGISEESAHDLTSPVLNQTQKIQEQYGGDEQAILNGIIEELGTQAVEHPEINESVGKQHMRKPSSGRVSEVVKERLMNEMSINSFEADRLKLAVLKEAKDITTILRGRTKEELSHAIIDMAIDRGDASIIYGIAGNSSMVDDLEDYLTE